MSAGSKELSRIITALGTCPGIREIDNAQAELDDITASAVKRFESQQEFVVAVDGDGAMCVIVPERDLKGTIHGLACTCEAEWDECETEGVSNLCATLDDDDYWTLPYPDEVPFQWTQPDAEESPITVTRITHPITGRNRT